MSHTPSRMMSAINPPGTHFSSISAISVASFREKVLQTPAPPNRCGGTRQADTFLNAVIPGQRPLPGALVIPRPLPDSMDMLAPVLGVLHHKARLALIAEFF